MIEFLACLFILSGPMLIIFIFDVGLMLLTSGEEGLLLYFIKKGIDRLIEICKGLVDK